MAEQAQEVEATLATTRSRALNKKAPTLSLVAHVSWHNKLLNIQGGWSPINMREREREREQIPVTTMVERPISGEASCEHIRANKAHSSIPPVAFPSADSGRAFLHTEKPHLLQTLAPWPPESFERAAVHITIRSNRSSALQN